MGSGFQAVTSAWVGGNLVYYDVSGNEIFTIDGVNRKITLPSGSDIDLTQVLDGADVSNVADDNLTGGIPIVHRLSIADQATGSVDYVLAHKTRVIDAWVVKTGADGHATEDTITVSDGTTAITDAMAIGLPNDTGITRATTINDATHEIAAAGTLGVEIVRGASGGNNTECIVYVLGLRVA